VLYKPTLEKHQKINVKIISMKHMRSFVHSKPV